jgi:hypothetical protein
MRLEGRDRRTVLRSQSQLSSRRPVIRLGTRLSALYAGIGGCSETEHRRQPPNAVAIRWGRLTQRLNPKQTTKARRLGTRQPSPDRPHLGVLGSSAHFALAVRPARLKRVASKVQKTPPREERGRLRGGAPKQGAGVAWRWAGGLAWTTSGICAGRAGLQTSGIAAAARRCWKCVRSNSAHLNWAAASTINGRPLLAEGKLIVRVRMPLSTPLRRSPRRRAYSEERPVRTASIRSGLPFSDSDCMIAWDIGE